MNNRFYGYNRNDYYFAKSCKEAFGSHFYEEKKKSKFGKLIFIIYLILISLTFISLYK